MSPAADPVEVRIVGSARAQVAVLAVMVAGVGLAVVAIRWKRYGPFIATRTARRLRLLAQKIEDAGLDIARAKETDQ